MKTFHDISDNKAPEIAARANAYRLLLSPLNGQAQALDSQVIDKTKTTKSTSGQVQDDAGEQEER